MTIRQKMDALLQNNSDFIDCGTYHIDGRTHGVLQNTKTNTIQVVYQSKEDLDENGNHAIKEIEYFNLKEMLEDFVLMMSVH